MKDFVKNIHDVKTRPEPYVSPYPVQHKGYTRYPFVLHLCLPGYPIKKCPTD
jgi:hypothetical protein